MKNRRRSAAAPNGDHFGLTGREREVARLLVSGLTYKEMAEALNLSANTVATHVKGILAKLDVPSSRRAVLILRDLFDDENIHPNG